MSTIRRISKGDRAHIEPKEIVIFSIEGNDVHAVLMGGGSCLDCPLYKLSDINCRKWTDCGGRKYCGQGLRIHSLEEAVE